MKPIIEVTGLSKAYMLGHKKTSSYRSIREELVNMLKSPFRETVPEVSHELFWALKDVGFSVNPGERVAIVGRNGAGKSTLLKILSRVTKPTEGTVSISGRMSSLLEVGTGFHPELTGRENIYLNGAILGMKNSEIRQKFDEIVDFSEISQFLDTPVKRYSSGMYVRLAFSVSAFLETDLVILDEVLSVGDASFQMKSQSKMLELSKSGRTIIFVSHSMSAIKAMCNQAIVMERGFASEKMPVDDAIAVYLENNQKSSLRGFPIISKDVEIIEVKLRQYGVQSEHFDGDEEIQVEIAFRILKKITNFRIGFFIKTNYGETLLRSLAADWIPEYSTVEIGTYQLSGKIPADFLTQGSYIFELHSSQFGVCDYFGDRISFPIQFHKSRVYNQQHPSEEAFGSVHLNAKWFLSYINND